MLKVAIFLCIEGDVIDLNSTKVENYLLEQTCDIYNIHSAPVNSNYIELNIRGWS